MRTVMRIPAILAVALLTASCVSGPGPSLEMRPSTASPAAGQAAPRSVIAVISVSGGFRNAEARQAFKDTLSARLSKCGATTLFMTPPSGGGRVFAKDVLEDGRPAADVPHDHVLFVREARYEVSGGLTTSYLDAVLKNSSSGKEVWRTAGVVRRTMIMSDGMNEFAGALVDRMISDRLMVSCR